MEVIHKALHGLDDGEHASAAASGQGLSPFVPSER